jgi:hypothetical protein
MTKQHDAVEVAATIRRSIEMSTRGSCRVRFYQLRDLFGFRVWSEQRKEFVAGLLADQGIAVQPPLTEVSLNDWLMLSLHQLPSSRDDKLEHRPTMGFFDQSVRLDTELGIETHFAGPLFREVPAAKKKIDAVGSTYSSIRGVSTSTITMGFPRPGCA